MAGAPRKNPSGFSYRLFAIAIRITKSWEILFFRVSLVSSFFSDNKSRILVVSWNRPQGHHTTTKQNWERPTSPTLEPGHAARALESFRGNSGAPRQYLSPPVKAVLLRGRDAGDCHVFRTRSSSLRQEMRRRLPQKNRSATTRPPRPRPLDHAHNNQTVDACLLAT